MPIEQLSKKKSIWRMPLTRAGLIPPDPAEHRRNPGKAASRSRSLPRLAILLLAVGMAAAAEEPGEPQALVKIDDFTLTSLHFALFANQTGRSPQDPEEQVRLLNELVNNFMVANSPQGQAMAGHPEVAAALDVARARLIAQTFVRTELEKIPIDEAQVQSLYDAQYGGSPRKEFKARHILLNSEEDAHAVIRALDGGADFAQIAEERSTGPSKSVGGDLGWFGADEMVSEFAGATALLADGEYSKTPVKTEFGWHVILREQSRDLPPPDLESVREDIEREIRQGQVAKLIADIREKTRIEIQQLE